MSIFSLYLKLGFNHIVEYQAFDHILFIISLVIPYSIANWRKILVLVTAFTIGHSITLALSVLNIILINTSLVELLISITILLTAISNLKADISIKLYKFRYITALFFGLIHGLGFSGYLKMLLGQNQNVVTPLFAFNIGIEIGQILIVLLLLFISEFLIRRFNIKKRVLVLSLSIISIIISSILIINNLKVL
jgi:hypothetical protein